MNIGGGPEENDHAQHFCFKVLPELADAACFDSVDVDGTHSRHRWAIRPRTFCRSLDGCRRGEARCY